MINVRIYEKLATGAKAVGAKAIKVAMAIDKTCKGIAWNMAYKELQALEKSNRRMKSNMIISKCHMERNAIKVAKLRDYLN